MAYHLRNHHDGAQAGPYEEAYKAIVADCESNTKEQEDELKAATAAITKASHNYSEPSGDEPARVLKRDLTRVLSHGRCAGKPALKKIDKALSSNLPSIESVKTRRDPVCVAIFGGMGTGKSLLVNKLCDVGGLSSSAKTEAGKACGTTRMPVLIKYSETPKLVARLAPTPLLMVDEGEEPLEALGRWAHEDASEDQTKRVDVWSGNESELAGMRAALEAAVERNPSEEHALIFFELHWPAPGLKDLNIHVMDLPGHNERDSTQQLKCRIVRALHHAQVVLTTDTSDRGVIGKELFSSLNEHGWLHHRHTLPAVGVVQNLKKLEIAGWDDNPDQFRATWAVDVRAALDEEFEDIGELPHRDAKNISWLKSGIRVEALPDYSKVAAPAFRGSALHKFVDKLCRDFRTRNERVKAIVCVRKLYQQLHAVQVSLDNKKYSRTFKQATHDKGVRVIKGLMNRENEGLTQLRSNPRTPFGVEPWASSWDHWRALAASETEQNKRERTKQTRTAFGDILKSMGVYFESRAENHLVFRHLQSVVLQNLDKLGNELITKHKSEEQWSDVVNALAKPITLWYEHSLGELGTSVQVPASTRRFWAAYLAKQVEKVRFGLGDHLRKKVMDKLDETWRPILDGGARPTLLRSDKGKTLKLPTRGFKTIAEASKSGEGVIAPSDDFVRKFRPDGDGKLAQTRSCVKIMTNPTEDAPKPQIHDGIMRIDATLNCTDETLEVSSAESILKAVAQHAERVVNEAMEFQNNENGAAGPSLCPIVLFSDRQPRARDQDFKPRLHIHDLVDFVNKRRGQDGSGPVGSFILFVVHEEYEVFEENGAVEDNESADDSGYVTAYDSASDASSSTDGDYYSSGSESSSADGMWQTDTLAKMQKSFMDELDKLKKSGLPGIQVEQPTWRVVEIVVKRRDEHGDHGGAAVSNCGPKLGIGRLRSVAQLLMEKWLRAPLYYQLDDDIQCEEFSCEARMFRRGSCTTGRALAFLHMGMDMMNEPSGDNLAERVSMLQDFKVLLGDFRDGLGTRSEEKKLKKALNRILGEFLEQEKDLKKAAWNYDKLAATLSQFDGVDFGRSVGERAHKLLDEDEDEGAKAIFRRMEERGSDASWWSRCDTFGAFLAEILGVKRCAHAALGTPTKSDEAYVNRTYDDEGAQMLHKKEDAYPTHRVGLDRDKVMMFKTSALRQVLFVDDKALFAEPMDPNELEEMLKVARRRPVKSKPAGKWRPEGRKLAKYGYMFSESYYTRRLLGHGLSGFQSFKYVHRKVMPSM